MAEPKSLNLINDVRKLIPLNVRAMSDFVLGGGGEFTEKDLSMGDKKRLLGLASSSINPGKITYEDYMRASDPEKYGGKISHKDRDEYLGSLDITDPYYNLATFLGQAAYNKDDEGILNIVDSFDFNEGTKGPSRKYSDAFEEGPVEGIMNLVKYFKDTPSYGFGMSGEDKNNFLKKLYSTMRYAGGQLMDISEPIGVDIKI